MTPEQLTAKLQTGQSLLVRQRVFHRLSYISPVGGTGRPVFLGIIASQELVDSLTAIPSRVYTAERVTFAEFEDPDEPQPRVPVYLQAAQLEAPVAVVATLDTQLATQLAAISPDDVATLLQAFRPPPNPAASSRAPTTTI